MKQKIEINEYAGKILEALPKGILLTTKAGNKINTMTIGWGTIGIEWAKPLFTVFVRDSRFTRVLLEENGEFAVNVPLDDSVKEVLNVCGTQSGRDVDKIKMLGLTLEDSESISVPAIREFPLTLECRVVYKQRQEEDAIFRKYLDRFYPAEFSESCEKEVRDIHTAYYGEIVAAYIIK